MSQNEYISYVNNDIIIKKLPIKGEDLQVFVRPEDSIKFPQDLNDATYQIIGGDIIMKLPDGGHITFVSMGLLAFTENSVSIDFSGGSFSLIDILSQVDDVKEAPVESVITDEFVTLDEEYSDVKEQEILEKNENFSKILQEPVAAIDVQKFKKPDEDTSKPKDELEENNFDAVYKPTDDNPINVNISEVNNAVEAGLKFTLTAYQTPRAEVKDVSGFVIEVDGGGGSAYGSQVDTPEAQFQTETLDYSLNSDSTLNTRAMLIHADAPKLFKTDPTDITSESQLARDLSIKPEQPVGFGISQISISNLPNGFKIVGATLTSSGAWEVPEATYDAQGNLLTDGFSVNINTGRARFTMTYPDDLLEGDEVTAVINFTSTFDTKNLLPGENVDSPDVTSLAGQGRLNFVTKEIDWESSTGYEDFMDEDKRVVLATNPNNNVIFTSHGDSTVYGGEGKDTVTAYEGNDTISGAKGDDTLDGGAGNDTLKGELGADTLIGKSGTNILDGGDDLDTVDYNFVTDVGGVNVDLAAQLGTSVGVTDTLLNIERVVGSSENDLIQGDASVNILEGASGVDTLDGRAGSDTLLGGDGNDSLDGGTEDDTLFGGTGNDSLIGGDDNDVLYGEAGNDTLFYDLGDDTLDGGLGSDTMDFRDFTGGVVADIYQGDVTISNNTGNDVITNMEILSGSADTDQLTGGSDDNTLLGQAGDDTLRGNEGNDFLSGGDGADTLRGGQDIDTLEGDAGDDILFGEAGADKLDGGLGIDTASYSDEGAIRTSLNEGTYVAVNVSGGDSDQIRNIENIKGSNTGNDSIMGDGLSNILDGQGGDDTIDGAAGVDTVLGGAGDDTLSGGAGDDDIQGGSGNDTANYQNEGRVIVDLANSGTSSVDVDAVETDTLLDIENITGSNSGNDTIIGNADGNTLKGLGGVDTLSGEEGDDVLDGGNDNDTLYGGLDQDTLQGSFGDDFLEGGLGNDIIDGGAGVDVASYAGAQNAVNVRLDTGVVTGDGVDSILNIENIIGSDYKDTIVGNSSVNILSAGAEDDIVYGGLGEDTLLGESGADTLDGGEGIDRLYGEDNIGTVDSSVQDMASYKGVTSGVGVTVDLTNDNSSATAAKVLNDGYNSVDYLYDIENVRGTDNEDFIIGDINANYLLGENAEDTLYGGGGDDTLDGGADDDTLRGNVGNDTLLGGSGQDTADYTAATTAIKVDLANYISGFNVSEDGEGTQDRLVGVENIIGSDLVAESDTIIGDVANNVLSGLSGDDTLKGGSGLDTLDGGLGNDTLFGGADADSLIGGDGLHDIVDFSDVSANGVKVNLEAGTATGNGDDKLFTIEDIRGSGLDDTLSGDTLVNTIYGDAGDDILEGGEKVLASVDEDLLYGEDGDDTLRGDAGDDRLYGGDASTDTGQDTADYSTVTNATATGINADLTRVSPQVTQDGYNTQDTLFGIENISGTQYADLIKGSDTVTELNVLSGNVGDDSFVGSDGADSILGGDGKDTIDYNNITNTTNTGIVMDFDSIVEEKSVLKTTATNTYIDKVQSIERIISTEYADDMKGDAGANEYFGMSGNDTILGKSGNDTIYGDDFAGILSGNDTLDGGEGDDQLYGGQGNDFLIGGKGNDLIDGGDDFDIVDYTASEAKITLDGNSVIGVDTGTDILSNIELIYATNYADTLVGSASKDVIDGRGGVDTILGKDGADTLYGYTGSDTINGGLGNDVLIGGSDADIDTVGFNTVVVDGTGIEDLNSVVSVDLESQNSASVVSLNQSTAIVVGTLYSFDVNILDATGAVVSTTSASHTALATETGDDIIAALYAQVSAITGIDALQDVSNSPNNDVDFNSHRILFMDNSTANGFSITGIDTNLLATEQAGVSTSLNALTGNIEKDFLFDFDNITGTDIVLDGSTRVGDTLEGNSANNMINAGDGDDTIFVTAGTDILDGQDGSDWVDYSKQLTHAEVDLDDGAGVGSDNFGDTLENIENVRGSDVTSADTIFGDANANILEGGNNNNGNDTNANYETLRGGAGDDIIYGDYLDTLSAIGGRDVIYGDGGDDTLYGGAASDRFRGGLDADTFIGGSGFDYVYYNDVNNDAISIDLTNNIIDARGDVYNGVDIYQEIEYIYGSDGGADYFRGDENSTNAIAFNGLNGADTIIGGAGNENLIGEDGNDLLTGGAGNDILSGQNNNDTFFAQEGVDTISGGAGEDLIDFNDTSIMGTSGASGIEVDLRATYNIGGTNYGTISDNGFGDLSYILGVENLNATSENDIFTGDDNKNIVNLYGGDDRAFLSLGSDTLDGGTNNLLVRGTLNVGKDIYTDGSGGDWIDASLLGSTTIYLNSFDITSASVGSHQGFEHIVGSDFSDTLIGDIQDNSILALDGNDTLAGGEGYDYLDGGAGNDLVTYSSSVSGGGAITVHYDDVVKNIDDGFGTRDIVLNVETIEGSSQNDVFYGSSTSDTFLSGGGQDSFVGSLGDDYLSGNEGGVAASLVDYSATATGNKLILDLGALSDQAQLVATADSTKYFTDQLQSMKNLIATFENDTLTGSSADNSMYGLAGDDTFFATDGNDTYDGGTETNGDWVDYSVASTKIVSDLKIGSTSKGINGSSDGLTSIEHIETGSNADTITASSADNTIVANAGDDTIYSNAGTNVFFGDGVDLVNSGLQDTIRYDLEDTGSGVKVNISTTAEGTTGANSATNAYGETDTLYNFENIIGSANGDILVGNDLQNSILGGAGADEIIAKGGNDSLLGATGNDTISGGAGLDFISGGDDDDLLYGEADGDFIEGGTGNDIIDGGSGNDTLFGEAGYDTFKDSLGVDTIDGGAGDDLIEFTTVNFDATDGNDTVSGGANTDTLEFLDAITQANLTDTLLTNISLIETIKFSANSGNDIALNQDAILLQGSNGVDTFNYTAIDFNAIDTLDGGNGTDELKFTTAATKTLADFGNVSNIETLTTSSVADNINIAGGSRDFSKIDLGDGDDTLTIDANTGSLNTKVFDGGVGIDTLNVSGTLSVDLSQTTINNFENIEGSSTLTMTLEQANDFTTVTASGTTPKTLIIKGNGADSTLDAAASHIVAEKIDFQSLDTTTTVTNIYTDIDASAAGTTMNLTLDDVDGIDIVSASTTNIDATALNTSKILNVSGAGVVDIEIDNDTTLGASTNSGTVIVTDTATSGINAITTGAGDDTITSLSGADVINSGDGNDLIIINHDAIASIDGGAGTADEIRLDASGLDLSSITINAIEKISFNIGGSSNVTMNSSDINSIEIVGDTGVNSIIIANSGLIDLSSANLTSVEELVFSNTVSNTITADLNGVNLLFGDSGDTLNINATTFTSADTITGGAGTDTIVFTNGGTVVDSAFTNVSAIETIEFSDNATNLTLGTQAGNILTVTGGLANDSLTLTGTGSYTNISKVETLNIDRTIDLSAKIPDVESINVLATNGILTLDADDFTSSIIVNNDNTVTINDATTATISNLSLAGSTGNTTINLTAGGTTIDFGATTFAGNVSIVGSSSIDTITMDEGIALINGGSGSDELIIATGASDTFANKSIINVETLTVNESVSLVGSLDDALVTDIDVASGKTLTLSAVDLSGKTIDFGGVGDTTFTAGVANANDYNNISVSGGSSLTMQVTSVLDISGSASDNLGGITHVTLGSGNVFTLDASQSDSTLNINGNATTSDVIIKASLVDSDNDFTSFINAGSGNIILDVVEDMDKSGEAVSILGAIDSINIVAGKTLTLDASQISNLDTLNGTGILNVNALGGVTDLSGLVNGTFSGTINIINSNGVDTITGSLFDDNIVYSSDAQNDIINGGAGNNTLVASADADLSAIAGVNLTNIADLQVSGNFTATVDKDFVDNSSVTTYTGGSGLSDFVQVALLDGESIDLTPKSFADLKVKIDVAAGGANSTIVGNDEVANIITVTDGVNDITTFNSDDTVNGGSGTDIVTIGGGDDVVNANGGDDVVKVATNSLTSADNLDGGTGNNILEYTSSSTTTIDATDFTNITNFQTLKLSDGDNSMDFSTNAGSISIIDGTGMTSASSNLTLTTGSQLNQVTAGAGDDVITYADINFSSADDIDGSGGIDRLIFSDAATITSADLNTNVTNVEVLQLSDNVNSVDVTASSIDSLEGGSASDSVTVAGDELSIKTNAGDDTVYISSVPTGLVDGGTQTTVDTLDVTGDLDLSSANIINFEKIVASGSITLDAAQATGVTMVIAPGESLTIKNTSGTTTLNAANITGGQINVASLTAVLAIVGLATRLDASGADKDLDITTADGSLDIVGSTNVVATTNVIYTESTTLSANVSDIDQFSIVNGKTLTATAAKISGQNVNGAGEVSISDASTTLDLSNITNDVNLLGDTTLGTGTFGSGSIDIANTKTLTTDAVDISGKTVTGTGTVAVTNLEAKTDADFSNVAATTTLNVEWSGAGIVTYTGNLINVDALTVNSGVMSVDASKVSGLTVNGTGGLNLLAGNSTIDLVNVSGVTLTADIDGGSATLSNLGINIDASNSSSNLTVDVESGVTSVNTGSGDDNIQLAANDMTNALTIDANGAIVSDKITLTSSALDLASGDFANVSNVEELDFFSGNDTLTMATGSIGLDNIQLNLGGGDDTYKVDADDLTSADIVDGGIGTNTLEVTSAGTITDADFTNISNFDVLSLSNGADSITLDNEADQALVDGASVFGNDDADNFTVDFSKIGKFVIDGGTGAGAGTNNDTVALTGSGTTSIVNTQFDNIENLNITGLNTGDTLDITYDNLKAWSQSGATEFTMSVNDTAGVIDTNNQFQQVDNTGTTNITTTGDYTFTDGVDSITLHVV